MLNKAKIGIDLDSNEALTQIRLITIQLDRLAQTRDIGIRTNFGAVSAAVVGMSWRRPSAPADERARGSKALSWRAMA